MVRHSVSLTLLLGLVVFLVAPGQGQEKTDKDTPAPAEKDKTEKDAPEKDKGEKDKDSGDKDKGEKTAPTKQPPPPPNPWVKVGSLTGRVRSYQEDGRTLALTIKVPELNQGAVQGLAQAQLALQQANFRAPQDRPQAIRDALNQIAQHQANLYTARDQDVTVKLHDDVKVRLANPPQKFDEKGRLVTRYTQKELAEMKGTDRTLPGYTADLTDLGNNQVVAVTLVQHKDKMKARPKRPTAPGGKTPDNADADLLMDDNKPQVSVVLIIGSPAGN